LPSAPPRRCAGGVVVSGAPGRCVRPPLPSTAPCHVRGLKHTFINSVGKSCRAGFPVALPGPRREEPRDAYRGAPAMPTCRHCGNELSEDNSPDLTSRTDRRRNLAIVHRILGGAITRWGRAPIPQGAKPLPLCRLPGGRRSAAVAIPARRPPRSRHDDRQRHAARTELPRPLRRRQGHTAGGFTLLRFFCAWDVPIRKGLARGEGGPVRRPLGPR
jgi:hypothetical protein